MVKRPAFLLVRPQLGENIGAVARAMSNFGLAELRLCAPRDGWPNEKALITASGAESIVKKAKLYPDFNAAMADIQVAYATTARPRDMEKRVIEPEAAAREMHDHMEQGRRVALVFGPERAGLTNEEIIGCDTLITIPTAPENHSLNLAQSAVILSYEWIRQSRDTAPVSRDLPTPSPRKDLQGLYAQLEEYLDASDYFRVAHKKPVMWQNLQNMLLRAQLSAQEVRTFRGMLRSLWKGQMRKMD